MYFGVSVTAFLLSGLLVLLALLQAKCETAIEAAEARVREFACKDCKSYRYADQLIGLACAYKSRNMRRQAELTYNKAIAVLKLLADANERVPEKMMYWAGVLALPAGASNSKEKDEDISAAEKLMDEALSLYQKMPGLKRAKCLAFIQQIQFLRKIGKNRQALQQEKKLDALLSQAEKNKGISSQERILIASTLEQLSVFHTGFFSRIEKPSYNSASVGKDDYTAGENYRLRALNCLDKLDASNPRRLESHRIMSAFYEFYGKKDKAEKERDTVNSLQKQGLI